MSSSYHREGQHSHSNPAAAAAQHGEQVGGNGKSKKMPKGGDLKKKIRLAGIEIDMDEFALVATLARILCTKPHVRAHPANSKAERTENCSILTCALATIKY